MTATRKCATAPSARRPTTSSERPVGQQRRVGVRCLCMSCERPHLYAVMRIYCAGGRMRCKGWSVLGRCAAVLCVWAPCVLAAWATSGISPLRACASWTGRVEAYTR